MAIAEPSTGPALTITMLPAQDGDCLLVEADGYRIVIDGGRAATGAGVLPEFLNSLPARAVGPTVDLMILTHIDADHIEGLLTFMRNLGGAKVGEIWFNGLRHHWQATRSFALPQQRAGSSGAPRTVLGVSQAVAFEDLVKPHGEIWNAAFAGNAIMVESAGELPRIPLTPTVAVVLLGPPRAKLASLYPNWATHVSSYGEAPVLAGRPGQIPTVANVTKLATERNVADKSAPNGGSIAFVLEVGQKRALFAADAHPLDLAAALDRYSPYHPVWFEAIKVPHHGSAANNTQDLVSRLASDCWLISTDGSRHGHPDVEGVARIVLAKGDGKRIVFSHRSNISVHWDCPDLRALYNYTPHFGGPSSPVTVNL